ncbi:MAG: DUF1223 domain-containing protein [Burkholderiaceae bacterium]
MKRMLCTAITLIISMVAVQSAHAQCRGETGKQTTALVELFTSEGCDSCPPADKAISKLKPTDKAVPIAWHVDYWDRLGWKDRFARADASVRQRDLVAAQGSRSVYTPQWIASGKTVQPGNGAATIEQAIASVNKQAAPVWMALTYGPVLFGYMGVELAGEAPAGSQVFIALVEDGITSQVTAGENKGALLTHDHVVREVVGPLPLGVKRLNHAHSIGVPQDANPVKLRVVAWAQDAQGRILNAVAATCQKNS